MLRCAERGIALSQIGERHRARPDGRVLVRAAEHQHEIAGERNGGGIPSRIFHIRAVRWLRTLDVERVAPRIKFRARITREQLRAERITPPVRLGARLCAWRPRLRLRVKYVDLEESVVAVHVMTADDHEAAVGQGGVSRTVQVVVQPRRLAGVLEGGGIEGEVTVIQRNGVEFVGILEGVGMRDVENLGAVVLQFTKDARRHALAESLDDVEATVDEGLEAVGRSSGKVASPDRRVEIVDVLLVREGAGIDLRLNDRRVGDVNPLVIRESRPIQHLGHGRAIFPDQPCVDAFGAVHRRQRLEVAAHVMALDARIRCVRSSRAGRRLVVREKTSERAEVGEHQKRGCEQSGPDRG